MGGKVAADLISAVSYTPPRSVPSLSVCVRTGDGATYFRRTIGGRSKASDYAGSYGSPSVSASAETDSGEELAIASFHSTVCLQEVPEADISAEDTGGAGSSYTVGDLLSDAGHLQVA